MIAAAKPTKAKRKAKPKRPAGVPEYGVVEPDKLYMLREFRRRIPMKEWSFRQMRRKGLRVLNCHGRSFVLGRDFIDYVIQASEERASDQGVEGLASE